MIRNVWRSRITDGSQIVVRDMKSFLPLLLGLASVVGSSAAHSLCEELDTPRLLPGSTLSAADQPENLCGYFDAPAVLIVNTASRCGYTPQFKELQSLYEMHRDQGLVVLGFPSDNFGGQEYASAEKTAEVCYRNYGVSFPVFERSDVKGPKASTLFKRLSEATQEPRWNFHKYLVTPSGVTDFGSAVSPLSPELSGAVKKALASK